MGDTDDRSAIPQYRSAQLEGKDLPQHCELTE